MSVNKENKTIRISLDEAKFTYICKSGYFTWNSNETFDVRLTRKDIKNLATGKIIRKEENGDIFEIALRDIGLELIREIIKRSPVYSEIYNDIKLNN